MSSDASKINLVLDGVVRYTIEATGGGETALKAKWVSTRILGTGQPGTGHAVRRKSTDKERLSESGFAGSWTIKYYGPDGNLQVTPFLLDLEKTGDVCSLTTLIGCFRIALTSRIHTEIFLSSSIAANGPVLMGDCFWRVSVSRMMGSCICTTEIEHPRSCAMVRDIVCTFVQRP